ncbi:MAG: tRNA (adenosine(37)-N6)-dimethylallyltransferase MiaA [Clostridia bacterium]|nr:tRNA (adenosine(37)-N6)-dimethylallyltransferase MiaA [Clostridia bacterium]
MNTIPLLVICGPTASGKTSLSIKLAQMLDGEIISADSVQIYRGMDIGSAKPTKQEMSQITHHMIDIVDPWVDYSVSDFVSDSIIRINDIIARGKLPIICGGTGFYLHSLLYDLDFSGIAPNQELRNELSKMDTDDLYQRLLSLDPATTLHRNDRKRVIRSIEVLSQGGQINRFRQEHPRFHFHQFCLSWERATLYKRINSRCEEMILDGFIDEVNSLLQNPLINISLQSMQSIGYSQICRYLNGEISLDTSIEDMKQTTRRFAKRQLTWFRHESNCNVISCESYNSIDEICVYIKKAIE